MGPEGPGTDRGSGALLGLPDRCDAPRVQGHCEAAWRCSLALQIRIMAPASQAASVCDVGRAAAAAGAARSRCMGLALAEVSAALPVMTRFSGGVLITKWRRRCMAGSAHRAHLLLAEWPVAAVLDALGRTAVRSILPAPPSTASAASGRLRLGTVGFAVAMVDTP